MNQETDQNPRRSARIALRKRRATTEPRSLSESIIDRQKLEISDQNKSQNSLYEDSGFSGSNGPRHSSTRENVHERTFNRDAPNLSYYGQNDNIRVPNSPANQRRNSFAEKMPFPPNYDRRNHIDNSRDICSEFQTQKTGYNPSQSGLNLGSNRAPSPNRTFVYNRSILESRDPKEQQASQRCQTRFGYSNSFDLNQNHNFPSQNRFPIGKSQNMPDENIHHFGYQTNENPNFSRGFSAPLEQNKPDFYTSFLQNRSTNNQFVRGNAPQEQRYFSAMQDNNLPYANRKHPQFLDGGMKSQVSNRNYGSSYDTPYPNEYGNASGNSFQGTQPRERFPNKESSRKIKAPTFNGSYEEWPYFKRLFLHACSLNGWSTQESFYNLLSSLNGDARSFIISMEAQLSFLSFEELLRLMENRFGVGDRSTHFQSLLEGRSWKWGDNLRLYQDEIRRLVSLAFPEVQGWHHQEILVKKYFINGVQDYNLKQRLLIDPPNTLEGAVQYCERFVAAKTAVDSGRKYFRHEKQDRVRMVRPCDEDSDEEDLDDSFETDLVNLLREKGYVSKTGKRDMSKTKCFNCQGFGHFAKDCPSPSLNGKRSFSRDEREAKPIKPESPSGTKSAKIS